MTTTDFKKHLGNEVRRSRKRCGLTQKQLGLTVGCGREYISSIEKGRQAISITKLSQILKVMDRKITLNFENIYK